MGTRGGPLFNGTACCLSCRCFRFARNSGQLAHDMSDSSDESRAAPWWLEKSATAVASIATPLPPPLKKKITRRLLGSCFFPFLGRKSCQSRKKKFSCNTRVLVVWNGKISLNKRFLFLVLKILAKKRLSCKTRVVT